MKKFGEFIRVLRIKKGLTLRNFCKINNIDPSNWSKIENGYLSPPKSETVLKEIAKSLGIENNSDEWYSLIDLAAISFIPQNIINNDPLLDKLPVFFRTLRGEKPTRKELEALIKIIKEG